MPPYNKEPAVAIGGYARLAGGNMKYLFGILLVLFLAMPVMAEDEVIEDNSDNSITDAYKIELGNGEGSIIVTGDNNIIYMPPGSEQEQQVQAVNEFNENTMSLVLGQTDIVGAEGNVVSFSKIVLQWQDDGSVVVVWTEQ